MAKSKKLDPTPGQDYRDPPRAPQVGATMVDKAVHELVIGRLAEAGRIYWMLLHDWTRTPGGAGYSGRDEIDEYFHCVLKRYPHEMLSEPDWEYWEKFWREKQQEALERMLSDTRMYLGDRSNQKLAEAFG